MKTQLFSKLFIAIALLTSASVFAQTTETMSSHENVKIEHSLKQNKLEDLGDIESIREQVEVNRIELSETTTDRRFNGRQFRIDDKKD
uniref:Uncharacterized protein n=1 Tax=Providencia stuartii TaxID=588 RepID=A0AAI9D8Z2_PROST|nr:hypothetical protein [Providencia stuartii]